ncbi:MAG: glycosyltransferase family 4 protein [Actinobacteria bacterium]|nr:glycosyltransferase family 4 protein [Actinomycetota bacterium]
MRILHVTDSYAPSIGGIERQVAALAGHQRRSGHDVRVVTAVPAGVDRPDPDVIHSAVARWRTSGSPLRVRSLSRRALEAPGGVDLVHAHLSVASPLAVHTARVASRRGIPTAVTVHSVWPRSTAAVRGANLPYWWGPIRAAWSAVGTVAAENVSWVLPALPEVLVVPNVVDTEWWRPSAPLRPTDPSAIRLVAVGRLAGRKRIGPLLDLLAAVLRDRPTPGLRLRIVGDGPRRRELQEQGRRLGIEAHLDWLGERSPEQIRELLHDSDLFIAPAIRESFGIAALEARAAGVPVLALRGTGVADFITDGIDGHLAGDDAELGRILAALITAPDRLAGLRAVTETRPPGLGAETALAAVDELYERATWRAGQLRSLSLDDEFLLDERPSERPTP